MAETRTQSPIITFNWNTDSRVHGEINGFKQSYRKVKVYPSEIAKRVAERNDEYGEVSVFSCFLKRKAAHHTTKDKPLE